MNPARGDATDGIFDVDGPPWARIEAALMSTSRMIRRAYDQRLSEIGINQTAAMVLAYLDEGGPVSQTRLAEAMGINRASAGAVIDALVDKGYLERQADPTDRRVWLVGITDGGRLVATTVSDIDASLRQDLRSGISRAERKQLAKTLGQLQRNLKETIRVTEA